MGAPLTRRKLLAGSAALAGLALAPSIPAAASGRHGPRALAWSRLVRLDKGFNIPGWADRGPSGAPADALLETLRTLGFGAVRLPVDPWRLVGADRNNVLKWSIDAAKTLAHLGYSVTFDMHPGAETIALFASDPENAGRLVDTAWSLLAERASGLPADTMFFELLNEPPLDPKVWLPLRDRLGETVRRKCPDHTLIWAAARYQALWQIPQIPVMPDPNAIVAVHDYEPMSFTHQCADWAGLDLAPLRDVPFPASNDSPRLEALRTQLRDHGDAAALELLDRDYTEPWTAARVAEGFKGFADWSVANDCPVVLNEFGVLKTCAPDAGRKAWIKAVRKAAEKAGFAWTYWEFDAGFGFVGDRRDPQSIDTGTVLSLLPEAAS